MKTKDEVFEEKPNNQTETSIIVKDTFKNLLFLIGITQFNMGLSQRLSE